MDHKRIIEFLESSFLSNLLKDEEITDISYNGESIFFLHNLYGRQKDYQKISKEQAMNFVRQIANLSEKQFSYTNPILDISFGKYRFNSTHTSIAKLNNEPVVNFSIRIASEKRHIDKSNELFFPKAVGELIDLIVKSNQSIVIGGITGSGKTEFQKYLISRIKEQSRIIIIDNVLELDAFHEEELDISIWQADEKNNNTTMKFLIKNALRNNPDWIIVAESRGGEMVDILNSAMSGHPVITTIHAKDVLSMPHRIARLVMMDEKKMDFDDVLNDIHSHFNFYFYIKRSIDDNGAVKRYLSQIMVSDNGKNTIIFENINDEYKYHLINENISKYFELKNCTQNFINAFLKGDNNQ